LLIAENDSLKGWVGRGARRACAPSGAGRPTPLTAVVDSEELLRTPQDYLIWVPYFQVWYCVGVERDSGGLCFVQRVPALNIEWLDFVLKAYIAPGTTLITDEHRTTLNCTLRLTEQKFTHYLIKHKEAYARWVDIEDPALAASLGLVTNSEGHRWLRVHTNKCEGLNAHLKHKLKRVRGTSLQYVDGYVAEAAFRQNSRARLISSPVAAFFALLRAEQDFPPLPDDDESSENEAAEEWEVLESDSSASDADES
jgi:hypothetical protein